jgi:GPH family glycoside/pentoside/hexuronide:cation symporter
MSDNIVSAKNSKNLTKDATFGEKLLWGLGGFGENMANNALPSLANAIYQVGYGLNPVILGWVLASSRIFDALIDPLIGNLSDNARSRWGRRRPFVVVGAILLAITFAFLWLPPAGLSPMGIAIYLTFAAFLFYLAFTIFVIPFSALGLEMVTDYQARTQLFIFRLVPAFMASLIVPTLYKFARGSVFGGNELIGMRYIGVIIAAVILLTALPAGIFCRERHATIGEGQENLKLFAAIRETLTNRPFVILLGAVFLTFFGLFCAIIVYSNLNIYYICGGNKDASGDIGANVGVIKGLGELAMLPVFGFLAVRFQKHRLAAGGLVIGAVGYLLSWFFYTPDSPYLQLIAYLPANLGLCACWLLNGSMMADICDSDELETGRRREGMFSAVFAICYKGGIAAGALFGNYLLQWAGVRGEAHSGANVVQMAPEVIQNIRIAYLLPPALCYLGAAGFMLYYPLTKARVKAVRESLENRNSAA